MIVNLIPNFRTANGMTSVIRTDKEGHEALLQKHGQVVEVRGKQYTPSTNQENSLGGFNWFASDGQDLTAELDLS